MSFALSSMTMKPIQFNHVGNQHGLMLHRIAAVGRSTPIAINSLTLIVIGSALVIHRVFALLFRCTSLYFTWV